MIPAPIPVDDAARLAALEDLHLLDTAPEERFDRITRLLTLVLRVPIAYISLVDADRQWFKSSSGLNVIQTPRATSFCGHAILSDEPLIIPDTAEDERFRDNPMVVGDPYIRFYAGCPLAGPGGHKVGTLCVADRRPRILQDSELETLREMARIVERELSLVEVARLQRDLLASQRHLTYELSQAARYVRSLLPANLDDGPVRTRWRFEPSSALGGDFFGYDWIDGDHFAVYLLDVSGHGVGAALLSVSVANALRGRTLPDTDFRDPATVLARLNDAFPMDRHDEKYFTIWYGVYERTGRRLSYASAGHPPALLLTGPAPDLTRPIELGYECPPIGMFPDLPCAGASLVLEPYNTLYVYSDGVYEIRKPGDEMMRRTELVEHLASHPGPSGPDAVWHFIQQVAGSPVLKDDFSLLEIRVA
jgi:sigma-B regulation protein RsbU (phosphoserine phosphatase)